MEPSQMSLDIKDIRPGLRSNQSLRRRSVDSSGDINTEWGWRQLCSCICWHCSRRCCWSCLTAWFGPVLVTPQTRWCVLTTDGHIRAPTTDRPIKVLLEKITPDFLNISQLVFSASDQWAMSFMHTSSQVLEEEGGENEGVEDEGVVDEGRGIRVVEMRVEGSGYRGESGKRRRWRQTMVGYLWERVFHVTSPLP